MWKGLGFGQGRVFVALFCCAATTVAAQEVSPQVRYQQQIKPVLEQHCVECHSGWFPKGGLRLDSLDNIREGGSNGPVLFPGAADKGKLINMIRIVPGRFSIMPPGAAAVSAEQFELIRRWIAQGAQ